MGIFDFFFGNKSIPPQEKNFSREKLENLIRNGQKIEAIKMVRLFSNAGLKDSKDFVEYLEGVNFSWESVEKNFGFITEKLLRLQEGNTGLPSASFGGWEMFTDEVRLKIENLIKEGQKIQAIKLVRETSELGLKEAKELVETGFFQKENTGWPSTSCGGREMFTDEDRLKIENLIREGHKIQAIKLVREISELGLKEAKDLVESMENDYPPASISEQTGEVNISWAKLPPGHQQSFPYEYRLKIENLIREKQLIQAIKMVREITGLGLREAKDFVEELQKSL